MLMSIVPLGNNMLHLQMFEKFQIQAKAQVFTSDWPIWKGVLQCLYTTANIASRICKAYCEVRTLPSSGYALINGLIIIIPYFWRETSSFAPLYKRQW